ncbi:uncharacterized protein CBL_02716 [Carabus blaptoides fortunei]
MVNVWLVFAGLTIFINCAQGYLYFERHGLPPADPPQTRAAVPLWGNITQNLDHFNSSNLDKWTMRYMYNGQFFRAGGPILIMLGAEWTIEPSWLQSGQMYDIAREHGAFMFYTEHRFYGQSMPRKVLTVDNLKYLNTDLALADVAYFIREIKKELPYLAQSRVIVFGGSYGGNMAIWIREMYPELIYAAVSSSAPILAKVDFKEYYESVQTNLGTRCSSAINKGIHDVLKYLTTPSGVRKVQRDFNTCHLLDTSNIYDVQYFFMMIASRISTALQYGNMDVVKKICDPFTHSPSSNHYESLANFFRAERCMSNYNDLVKVVNVLRPDGDEGLKPNVTRVISLHGTLDPWFPLGLSRDLNPTSPVIIINGTSHCADLYSISPADSVQLKNAKLQVQKYVGQWIHE